MELFSICYISKKSLLLSQKEVKSIAEHANSSNAKLGITGVLLEYKNHFLQYLEGPTKEVYSLFEKIKNDSRHTGVEIVQYRKVDERIFSNWNMLHKDLDDSKELMLSQSIRRSKAELDSILSNKEFWRGIDVIEHLSNLVP